MTTEDGYDRLERFDDVDATGKEAMFFACLDRIEGLADPPWTLKLSRPHSASMSGTRRGC